MPPTPSTNSEDWLQWVFFAIAACLLLYHMIGGWRRGLARQIVYLLALALSYLAAWFGSSQFTPMLRPLGYPDAVLGIIAGTGLALAVFLFITIAGRIAFKKTSQHEAAIVRFGYGISGAVLGVVSGLVFVWMILMGLHLLGAVAQSEVTVSAAAAKHPNGEEGTAKKPNGLVIAIAEMKHSVDNGVAAGVVRQVDPVPKKVYEIIDKMTMVLASPDDAKRFLDYPGAQTLVSNPKLIALRDDPDIVKEIKAKNYIGLLKNTHVVSLANDPTLYPLLKKFELEKALDYSLNSAQKDDPATKP